MHRASCFGNFNPRSTKHEARSTKKIQNFKNNLEYFLVFLFLIANSAFARTTSFENRFVCEKDKGIWRTYGNGCVDSCYEKFDKFAICARAITYGCDCGKGKCWDGEQCVELIEYKKVYDVMQEKDQKALAEAKEKRKAIALENQEKILSNLTTQAEARAGAVGAEGVQPQSNYSAPDQNKTDNSILPLLPSMEKKDDSVVTTQPQTAPAQNNNPQPLIPPFFLQQEKAKQQAEQQKKEETKTIIPPQTEPGLPALPMIPLPQ
ncbi:MAG: hypothetical protein A2887_03355 [Alphaproteobacteria bacterium RIFCSPLOWO2_01_FULL_40_26]|nr:MAG: hypothetical protein A3D15_03760 [Alphaproteobacteria bacterium RIFCSPHIGHO2_02_FULL_40_34]OFW94476.1 MAG: hypothetical protein A2887_03355 [Alphaproteobacteria bacterium RIFCSPLOWO2_01_FULL_40_26]OFX10187.1 MAG: hypothetical protein A3H30_01530 [Alphaproteobacteria bacterium RIFCSPLOWO2_02_FULL_40_19]